MRRFALSTLDCLLQGDSIRHAAHRILPLEYLQFRRSVLVEELIEAQVATTDLYLDLVTHAHDTHALAAELVNTI